MPNAHGQGRKAKGAEMALIDTIESKTPFALVPKDKRNTVQLCFSDNEWKQITAIAVSKGYAMKQTGRAEGMGKFGREVILRALEIR